MSSNPALPYKEAAKLLADGLLKFEIQYSGSKPHVFATLANKELCVVTPAAVAAYPYCGQFGNWGAKFGPADKETSKYELKLTSAELPDEKGTNPNHAFMEFIDTVLKPIDKAACDFVHANQSLLERRNLSPDEVQKLQRLNVNENKEGYLQFSANKNVYSWVGYDKKMHEKLAIYDEQGKAVDVADDVIPVIHGDICAAIVKFDCIWFMGGNYGAKYQLDKVQVICQRKLVPPPAEALDFQAANGQYAFATKYSLFDQVAQVEAP